MLDPTIPDQELLYIAVPSDPSFWSDEHNRPTSGLFKKKDGRSADRAGERQLSDIVQHLLAQFNDSKKLVYVSAGQCRQVQAYPVYSPTQKNEFHCDVLNSNAEGDIELTKSKARALSKAAGWYPINDFPVEE
jgi:hypothetical protein